jgi:hypothetical protein
MLPGADQALKVPPARQSAACAIQALHLSAGLPYVGGAHQLVLTANHARKFQSSFFSGKRQQQIIEVRLQPEVTSSSSLGLEQDGVQHHTR